MARRTEFTVLVGTDGSPSARAAIATAAMFPWPRNARVHAVVARQPDAGAGAPRKRWPVSRSQADERIVATHPPGARSALAGCGGDSRRTSHPPRRSWTRLAVSGPPQSASAGAVMEASGGC